ncbi:MAG: stalk domain-containing protein [Armatimonadetes bacterium]|nr:stalk domain-containing protein [Armatimonadota bacterium]
MNQREVSEEEVMRFAWARMGKAAIRDLADEILVRQAAAARGIKVTPAEVDARVKELAELAGGEQELVARRGVAGVPALRQQIETEMLLAKLVEAQGRVTDAEAREYYEAHKSRFTEPTRLHLYEIVTEEAEAAYRARGRLAAGEAFTAVAREVSLAASAAQGGDLGWLALTDIAHPVLRSVAATLKTGEVSTPVLVENNYYIYFLSEVRPGRTKSFEEVKDEVVEALRAQRGATPEGVLNALRRRATLVVLAAPFKYIEAEYEELKQIKVAVDGERVSLRPAPVMLPTGRLIVPAKPFFVALGCHVQWRAPTKAMVITRGKKVVQVSVGSNAALVDGRPVTLAQPPETRDGLTWVTPRQVAELLGFKVNWDPASYTLVVTSPAP